MSQELSDKEINNAFKKLKITPETEGFITENTDNLDNALKIMTLGSIDRFQGKKKRPDKDKDFLSKIVATNINANLFLSHSNIKDLFNNVNLELNKIAVWFKANKLSLNEGKTKYTFFYKFRQKDNIPLKLSALAIKGKVIEQTTSIKLLGILLDEHLS